MLRFSILILVVAVVGCAKEAPLYCDEVTPCTDPERPFCDLTGEHPGSDGHGRTCVANPFDAGAPDAPVERQWSAPEKLAAINDLAMHEQCAVVSADGLAIYFTRTVEMVFGFTQVFVATRSTPDGPFGSPSRATNSDPEALHDIDLSSSELELFHWGSLGSLRVATRTSTSGEFGPAVEVTADGGVTPSISSDGLSLYYKDPAGMMSANPYRRIRRSLVGGPFGAPENVSISATVEFDHLDVSADELSILLATGFDEPVNKGVYVGRRSTTQGAFTDLEKLFEGDFSCVRWSPDEQEIYLSDGEDIFVSRLE